MIAISPCPSEQEQEKWCRQQTEGAMSFKHVCPKARCHLEDLWVTIPSFILTLAARNCLIQFASERLRTTSSPAPSPPNLSAGKAKVSPWDDGSSLGE